MSYLILNVEHGELYDPYRTASEAADAREDCLKRTGHPYERVGNVISYKMMGESYVLTYTDGPQA